MPEITLFRDTYETAHPSFLQVEKALERIKSGTYKTKVNQLRRFRQSNKEKYDAEKPTLPAFVFQGKFSHRKNADLVEASGLFTADLDKLADADDFKRQIATDPTVYSVFISPSGVGVKALFKIPQVEDNDQYHFIFEKISKHVKEQYDADLDRACKDVARICYASYDPDIVINLNAKEFKIDWEEFATRQKIEQQQKEEAKKLQQERAKQLKADLKKSGNTTTDKLDELCQKRLVYHMQWMIDALSNASPSDPTNGRHQCYIKCGILAKSMLDGYASDLITLGELESHISSIRSDFRPVDLSTFREMAMNSVKATPETKADIWGEYQQWRKDHPPKKHQPQQEEPPHPAEIGEAPTQEHKQTPHPQKEKPLPKKGRADLILTFLAERHTFTYNEISARTCINAEPMSDEAESELYVECVNAGIKTSKSLMRDVIITECRQHRFHPLKDYFEALTWDGKDRINLMGEWFHDKDGVFPLYLRKWMIGAIAKVYKSHQNPMLVLVGAQGIGKGFFAKWLCPLPDLYLEKHINPDSNDDKIRLTEKFIWEASELGATTRRSDLEALKSFQTLEVVTFRRPYGHFDKTQPALASFIGTVNDDGTGFLTDKTGNRRYRPAYLTAINRKYTEHAKIDDLWAEAYAAFVNGETVSLDDRQEHVLRTEILPVYQVVDYMQELIEEHFERVEKAFVSTSEILRALDVLGYKGGRGNTDSRNLSKVMKALGYEKSANGKTRGYKNIAMSEHLSFRMYPPKEEDRPFDRY